MRNNWGVVIVAAGRGTRMGTQESKQYLELQGKPILVHTIERFEAIDFVHEIVLVVGEQDIARCHAWQQQYSWKKMKTIVAGGKERQESVYKGLLHINTKWTMVHDGVRPLVSVQAIENCCERAEQFDAAVLAVPVKDTIKQVDEQGNIVATPDRKSLWAIQTPQAFRHELLLDAHRRADAAGYIGTDDAMVVEWIGAKVVVAEGEYTNIKITTPEDLPWAEYLLTQTNDKTNRLE